MRRSYKVVLLLVSGVIIGVLITIGVQTAGFGGWAFLKTRLIGAEKVTCYDGVCLEMSMDEVRYIKGKAKQLFSFDCFLASEKNEEKCKDKKDSEYESWLWDGVTVRFEQKKAITIVCTKSNDECVINGVKIGSSEKEVGSLLEISESKKLSEFGGLQLDYQNYNMRIHLEKQKVTHIQIRSSFD